MAVPSSTAINNGTSLSMLGIANELYYNYYNRVNYPSQAQAPIDTSDNGISLSAMNQGEYYNEAINMQISSVKRPDQAVPHGCFEFERYDHNYTPPVTTATVNDSPAGLTTGTNNNSTSTSNNSSAVTTSGVSVAVSATINQATVAATAPAGGAAYFHSDIRLKENYKIIGTSKSGIPIYEFSYIGQAAKYIGTMAQDLLALGRMDAVITMLNGYYAVDYNKLDVEFKLIS